MNYTNHNIELPEGVELYHLSIRREGHGSYRIAYELTINGEKHIGSKPTNDFQLWDDWNEDEPTWYENAPQAAFDLVFELLS